MEKDIILSLLRYEFLGTDIPADLENQITPDTMSAVYKLSKKHDIAPIIADALYKNSFLSLDTDACRKFQDDQIKSVFRYENQNYELGRIKKLFEENEIQFIALKGSVIRDFYPEPWMRTSCDIDVLVKKDDIEKASSLLSETLKYKTDNNRSTHDVTFFSDGGVCLELHFDLNESTFRIFEPLSNAWKYAHIKDGKKYEFELDREFFVFYHLVHMAKHFSIGGCGIKPFIDLLILKQANFYNEEKLLKLCSTYKLKKFYIKVNDLLNVWFLGKGHTETTQYLEQYVITGGVYGSYSNRVFVKQSKSGGKVSFLLRRAFPSLTEIRNNFGNQNITFLQYPYYCAKRFSHLLSRDKREKVTHEVSLSNSMSDDSLKLMKNLLDELGL